MIIVSSLVELETWDFFSLYTYVSEENLIKFFSHTWNSLVLAAHLSKHSQSHWAVIFSKWDGQTLTLHNFTICSRNHVLFFCLIAIGIDNKPLKMSSLSWAVLKWDPSKLWVPKWSLTATIWRNLWRAVACIKG